jgi:acyl carrier protein
MKPVIGGTVAIIDQVLDIVAEITETDRVGLTGATVLADISWDSLAAVSFIAAADERFSKTLAPKKLTACTTVAALAALVEASE